MIDDYAIVAEGLSILLETQDDLVVVGTATDARQAISLVGLMRPDVVLVDYRLPDGDGAAVATEILRRWPNTKIIMLTAARGDEVRACAIEAGCSGFLPKERGSAELISAVRAVYRGEAMIPTASRAVLPTRMRCAPLQGPNHLTARELEVLELLAHGESTEQLREALFLSAHTVRNHVRNILAKLGAHSKLEAVTIAARRGIVSLS